MKFVCTEASYDGLLDFMFQVIHRKDTKALKVPGSKFPAYAKATCLRKLLPLAYANASAGSRLLDFGRQVGKQVSSQKY